MPSKNPSRFTSNRILLQIIVAAALLLFFLTPPTITAQAKPNCDASCGGGTTGSTSLVTARATVAASRASGTRFGRGHRIAKTSTVPGNNSFSYAVRLFHLPGRGLNLDLGLYYNSFVWTSNLDFITLNADRDTPSYGFRLDFGFFEMSGDGTVATLTEADGTKHPLTQIATQTAPFYGFTSTDASYVQVQMPAASGNPVVVTYRNGLRVFYSTFASPSGFDFRPYQIEDTNGNIIAITYQNNNNLLLKSITDTIGRVINFFYDSTGTMLSCVTTGSSCTASGATTYNFSWNPSYLLNFNFTKITGSTLKNGVTVLNVLTGVTRPDGTSVKFVYGDWAIVNQVQELSKTGNLRSSMSFNFPSASAGAQEFNPTYTQETLFDGIQTSIWTFQSTLRSTDGLATSMAVTNPTGKIDTITFSANGDAEDGMPTQDQISSNFTTTCALGAPPSCVGGTGTIIWRTTNIAWALDSSGANPRPTSVTTILEDAQTQSEVVFNSYDSNGNITDLMEYDFGPGAHGGLLKETVMSYAGLTNGILDHPSDLQVKDSNGNVLFHKKFNYDETTPPTPPTMPLGRDTNFSGTVRGNLTTTVVYSNAGAGTGAINSTFAYDYFGNLVNSQAGCCTFTQRNYSIATQYAYPDSVAVGPTGNQLTTFFTYNMATGTVATTTDPNGEKTSFTYDVDNRPLNTAMPDGVTVTDAYDDSATFPSVSVSSTANSLATETTLNGLGKTIAQQALNGTTPVSTRSFSYDQAGRLSKASNPYGSDTPVYTTYQYDTLGRITSVTPPAQNSSTGQNSYSRNYSLATTTFTDPAGKQRKQYRDGIGRLIRVDEPGLMGGQDATATATISGTEQSVATSSGNGATAGTASITFAGTERSTVVLTQAATPASVVVTIGGSDGTDVFSTQVCTGGPPSKLPLTCKTKTQPSADTGTIKFTATVSGTQVTSSAPYGAGVTPANIATALFNNFPANSVVTMSNPNGSAQFTLTTTATGSASNNATLSTQIIDNCQPSDTQSCSEGYTIGSGNFSGGTDAVNTTLYDTGAVTVSMTINGTQYSKTSNYGQNSDATTFANDLANQINADSTLNKLVIAGVTGGGTVLQLTTTATGITTSYPLSVTDATNSQYFVSSSTSFPATPSGSAFTPGQNGVLYDAGTIQATLTGFSETPLVETVTFGQGSTPTSIATSLAAAFHNDPYSPVDASAPSASATVTFTARTQGTDANSYKINIAEQSNSSSSFPTPSFSTISIQLASGLTPSPSFDPSVVLTTNYSYDAMGHLLQSVEGQQTRTYQYDSLGRVTSSTIPETGYQTTTASYTDFGAPSQIVDPRLVPGTTNHIATSFSYDPLNRPQTITYNDGTPSVTYAYNPPGSANNTGGRLANVGNTIASENYQYDLVGRVLLCSKAIAGQTYNTSYQYNPDGTLAKITYPSGRTVTLGEDGIGRIIQIGTNGNALLNIGSYNAAGEILSETYGNGVAGTYTYNNQLQLATLQYTGSAAILNLTYNYGGAEDNGQIQGITDGLVSSRSTSYGYDELGRLKAAQTNDVTSPNTWELKFSYDRYGNRVTQIPVAGTASMPMNEVVVDPTTNHITSAGYGYDAAGDMTSDGLYNYAYNAVGQMTSVTPVNSSTATATFSYDAYGLRVVKNGTVYIYSGRKVIAEYASGAAARSPTTEHIYRGELRLATIASGVTTYHYSDHLSVRADTDGNGNVVRSYGQYPFGETWYEIGTADKWKFTSYENDIESGLNYADARFQSPRVGRFTALDPLAGFRANPQSLNRYVYGNNDPVNVIDPTGMEGEGDDPGSSGCYVLQTCGGDNHSPEDDDGWGFWIGDNMFICLGTCDITDSGDGLGYPEVTAQFSSEVSGNSQIYYTDGSAVGFDNDQSTPYTGPTGETSTTSQDQTLDVVQAGLMAVGFVPGIGDVANGINAVISLSRGNYADAALYAISAIPVAGVLGEAAIAVKETEAAVEATEAASRVATEGEDVYRAWGGAAKSDGHSWTPIDPDSVSNFRDAAGLPNANTGEWTSVGTLKSANGVQVRSALPLDGNAGGLTEYLVPDVQQQIEFRYAYRNAPPK